MAWLEVGRVTSLHQVHDGLAVYRLGNGEPVLLMPAPHRFERPGLREFDALAAGLQLLGHQVITYDPPGSGHSTRPARLNVDEMHQCATQALQACGVVGPVDGSGTAWPAWSCWRTPWSSRSEYGGWC